MNNENLIPSLIVDDKDSLPIRGGKYISKKEREREKERLKAIEEELAARERSHYRDLCDCHDCNC